MHDEISRQLFGPYGYDGRNWPMSFAERFAMVGILQRVRPQFSVEVGTFAGGSLSVISHFSQKVVSIDINPDIAVQLRDLHPNVEFISESSRTAFPRVLKAAAEADNAINFMLIDGDHSEEGVRTDIETALTYQPRGPLWILMHDSFNPYCRRGIQAVRWHEHPHVHWIDYDLVPGVLNSVPGFENQMWGGFALAYLDASERKGPLPAAELLAHQFAKVLPLSEHAAHFAPRE